MCGICGLTSDQSVPDREQRVAKMIESLSPRGPDGQGLWSDPSVPLSFGHARLAILDVSDAGHQPMVSNGTRYVISYNGEMYNYREVRQELEASGVSFRGDCDTEVLLAAIEAYGVERALKLANGMFAFALWDRELRRLTLARDRMGIKPLFFGRVSGEFFFSSEIKSIVAAGIRLQLNRAAVVEFLRYSYVPAPISIAEQVYKVPPGAYVQVEENELTGSGNFIPEFSYFWKLSDSCDAAALVDESNYFETVHQSVLAAVSKRMVADVPLGAFLSGGIDSSTIVACMQAVSSDPVRTFTIGFEEAGYNEAHEARKVAEHLGTRHTELYVTSKEAQDIIPALASIYDEPFADSSQIPTVLVSQLAAKEVKVCLSGDGGDEMFCGYNRYIWGDRVWRMLATLPLSQRKFLKPYLEKVPVRWWNMLFTMIKARGNGNLDFKLPAEKISKLCRVFDASSFEDLYRRLVSHWENPEAVVPGSSPVPVDLEWWGDSASINNRILRMMYLDSVSYLPDDLLTKVDRASMAHSLEVRVPFLDHTLVELAWRTPPDIRLRQQGGRGKVVLREILAKYMPEELFERPKMGFSVPVGEWLRGPLRDWAESLLDEKRLESQGIFQADLVREKWAQHLSLQSNCQYYLWDILIIQSWLEKELVNV